MNSDRFNGRFIVETPSWPLLQLRGGKQPQKTFFNNNKLNIP
jgi:hypothetical protein